jgi:cell division septation protein DedD
VPAPAKPASEAAESPPSGAAPAPAKAEPPAAPAPAPAEPKKVAGIRVGPPPEELLSSPQRGALVQAVTAPPLPEGAVAPPAPPPSRYAVQVARFLLPENAETLAASLRGRGYRPEIVVSETPATPAAPSWYLVVIDPKGDWKTAERLAIEVATTLGLPGQVVSWPLMP